MRKLRKRGLKWSTLNHKFSTNFHRKLAKFSKMMSKHPNIWKSNSFSKFMGFMQNRKIVASPLQLLHSAMPAWKGLKLLPSFFEQRHEVGQICACWRGLGGIEGNQNDVRMCQWQHATSALTGENILLHKLQLSRVIFCWQTSRQDPSSISENVARSTKDRVLVKTKPGGNRIRYWGPDSVFCFLFWPLSPKYLQL